MLNLWQFLVCLHVRARVRACQFHGFSLVERGERAMCG
jgi:hypothetical protein